MSIINLTPHKINLVNQLGDKREIEPSGAIARVDSEREFLERINKIDFYTSRLGDVKNLPDRDPDKYYIVSRIVSTAAPNREDLLVLSHSLRDEIGNIIVADGLDVVNK